MNKRTSSGEAACPTGRRPLNQVAHPSSAQTLRAVLAVCALGLGCGSSAGDLATPATAGAPITLAGSPAPTAKGVAVNQFMSYRPAERTVDLQLVAGYDGGNNTLNINGGTQGAHTVTVPVGWRIEGLMENRVDLPHSVVVVPVAARLHETPGEAAFSGAQTVAPTEGAGEHTRSPFSFVAERAGSYMIVCGVPFHGQAGMWIRLVVSDQTTVPDYAVRSAARATP
jgi:sulfocyanin